MRLSKLMAIAMDSPTKVASSSNFCCYSLRVSSVASPVEVERSVEDVESPRRCGDSVTL